MDKSELTEKLFELEKQVHLLKDELAPTKVVPSRWKRCSNWMGATSKWLGSHWFLITFMGALLTAGWVKYRYGVAYFEDPKNIATTKKLADFYRNLGDEMLYDLEYEAAASAYESSLALEKNNEKSAQGLVIARIYHPSPGQKFVPSEVVDYKLRHLLQQFPDDPQLLFIKSYQEYERRNLAGAIELAEKAIAVKPDFGPAHAQLGFYNQVGATDEAIKHYEKALEFDPESSIAQNNLGFCRMLQTNFPQAIELLEKSNTRVNRLVTTILLGDSYRYYQQFQEAIKTHEQARETLEGWKDKESELIELRYISTPYVLNYMPQRRGDTETFKMGIEVNRTVDTRSLLYYSLSLDYAMVNDFAKAEQAYGEAAKVEAVQVMKDYVRSHLVYMLNEMEMSAATRAWLSGKAQKFEPASP